MVTSVTYDIAHEVYITMECILKGFLQLLMKRNSDTYRGLLCIVFPFTMIVDVQLLLGTNESIG